LFQADCVEAYVRSWVARGFSPVTVETDSGVLERMLAALGRPAWEATAEDVDRVGAMAVDWKAAATRREYVQAFKGFHRFQTARKSAEIEAAFGVVRLVCPVDEFNASRHVGDDSPQEPPPTSERLAGFFEFLKARIGTARRIVDILAQCHPPAFASEERGGRGS
jgi:integrase/recombinase XerD